VIRANFIEMSIKDHTSGTQPILKTDDKMLNALLASQSVSAMQTIDSFLVYLAKIGLAGTLHENQQVNEYSFKLLGCIVSFKPKMERENFEALEVIGFLQKGCVSLIERSQQQTLKMLESPAFQTSKKLSEDVRKKQQSLRCSLYEILGSIGLSDTSDNFLMNSHYIVNQIFRSSEQSLQMLTQSPTALSYVLSNTLKDVVGVMTGIGFSEVMMGFLRIAYPRVLKLINDFESLGDIMEQQEFLLSFMEYQYRICKLISEKVYKHSEVTLTAMINLFMMTSKIGRIYSSSQKYPFMVYWAQLSAADSVSKEV
jgi:hypothetical protein